MQELKPNHVKNKAYAFTLVQGEKQPDQQRECKETFYDLKKTSPNMEAANNMRLSDLTLVLSFKVQTLHKNSNSCQRNSVTYQMKKGCALKYNIRFDLGHT